MSRLPLWQTDWKKAEQKWDQRAEEAARKMPLKKLKILPQMPGITEETAKGLKWKSLMWMIRKDKHGIILRGFLKHPLKYGWAFLKSAWRTKPFIRQDDFFLYGVESLEQFEEYLKESDTLLVLGFLTAINLLNVLQDVLPQSHT